MHLSLIENPDKKDAVHVKPIKILKIALLYLCRPKKHTYTQRRKPVKVLRCQIELPFYFVYWMVYFYSIFTCHQINSVSACVCVCSLPSEQFLCGSINKNKYIDTLQFNSRDSSFHYRIQNIHKTICSSLKKRIYVSLDRPEINNRIIHTKL